MEKIVLVVVPIQKSEVIRLRKMTKTQSNKDAILEAVDFYLSTQTP